MVSMTIDHVIIKQYYEENKVINVWTSTELINKKEEQHSMHNAMRWNCVEIVENIIVY